MNLRGIWNISSSIYFNATFDFKRHITNSESFFYSQNFLYSSFPVRYMRETYNYRMLMGTYANRPVPIIGFGHMF